MKTGKELFNDKLYTINLVDTIGEPLFSYQKVGGWETARSSRSSSETYKMLALQGCHNKKSQHMVNDAKQEQ